MFGGKKNSENLFIERWYQLLRENGRLAAVLPESVFDTTENKYIRLFLYKYFKIRAVVSLPQLTFQPFTPTKTSILFAQKKTKAEIEEWDAAWAEASKTYSALKTRADNLLMIFDGKKDKIKLPSVKELTPDEETEIIRAMLKYQLTERDDGLDAGALIAKYRAEIEDMCSIDKDTQDIFGFVNTWWVFGEVAGKLSYPVFMAEVDNIGYKRTARGEREMPNDLFVLEYAPSELDAESVNKYYNDAISSLQHAIDAENARIEKEKSADRIAYIDELRARLVQEKADKQKEYADVTAFINKYYAGKILREEYKERMDETLVKEFKNGKLFNWRSEQVALHENTYITVLDYMRDVQWD
jgi:type I restriction enzyme M protein